MSFNENTRVKIPALIHLTRLGYGYLSLKESKCDPETNIFTDIFKESIKRINPQMNDAGVKRLYEDINIALDGDIVLIYPKTADFDNPLNVFKFPESEKMRLWVLPFCLDKKYLIVPTCGTLNKYLHERFDN